MLGATGGSPVLASARPSSAGSEPVALPVSKAEQGALDAFLTAAADRGFSEDFPADSFDLLGIGGGSDDPTTACRAGLADLIAVNGAPIGQISGVHSDSLTIAVPDEVSLSFAATTVDGASIEGLDRIVETLGSEEHRVCVDETIASFLGGDDSATWAVEADDSLSLGDASARARYEISFDEGTDDEERYSLDLAAVRVGPTLLLMSYASESTESDADAGIDAFTAAAASLIGEPSPTG